MSTPDHSLILVNATQEGFRMQGELTVAGAILLHAHQDRLRALLDKPVILTLHWDDGDDYAQVCVHACDRLRTRPIMRATDKRFTLPFPRERL